MAGTQNTTGHRTGVCRCSVTQDSGYYNAGCYVTLYTGSIYTVWCHGVAEGQHWPGHSNHLLPLCPVTIITINLGY